MKDYEPLAAGWLIDRLEDASAKGLAAVHPLVTTREAARFLERAVAVGLAEEAQDGALVFPKLERASGHRPHECRAAEALPHAPP